MKQVDQNTRRGVGIVRPVHELIRAAARTADTERADWQGLTPRAKFEGAATYDKATKARRVFGRRNG